MNKFNTVEEYIDSLPNEVKEIINKIRKIGMGIIPDAQEVISYGIPTFKLNNKYIFYYSAYKNHISLYPFPVLPDSLNKKVEPHKAGKGTLQFKLKDPIPYDLIEEIIHYYLKDFKAKQK